MEVFFEEYELGFEKQSAEIAGLWRLSRCLCKIKQFFRTLTLLLGASKKKQKSLFATLSYFSNR
jgi:hypothetical protein